MKEVIKEMDLNLKDKVVMVTGSTGGVGEAVVKAFAAEEVN